MAERLGLSAPCGLIEPGGEMDQEYFRRFARRCRELMLRTANEPAREQLCLWAAEFEAKAATWESGGDVASAGNPDIGRLPKPLNLNLPCREATR